MSPFRTISDMPSFVDRPSLANPGEHVSTPVDVGARDTMPAARHWWQRRRSTRSPVTWSR